jgi:tRNA-2-methylthio-N6-dimethylallyladenosine synthase
MFSQTFLEVTMLAAAAALSCAASASIYGSWNSACNMPSVYVESYGCQMNLADTELMLGHLVRSGYKCTNDPAAADVILVNTCAIREHAEERIYGRLGSLARHKIERPHVRIGLTGCLAQHAREGLLDSVPCLDFIVGPDAYRRLPRLLEGGPLVDVRLDRDETYADMAPQREAGVRAWITVMRGCDRFCAFCVVPYVRGRERSLPVDAVLEQVRSAAADGYREVVFLGQTVNAYRHGAVDFAALLRHANAVDGILRIRFTSPHPCDMTDSVIDAVAGCDKVCPQIHLPVQSGSTPVLARMERGYSADEYLRLVERLRTAVAELAISTDIMVGFPGESEKDFEATLDLMRAARHDHAFMFKYSRRDHTRAAKWEETVSEEEKGRRLQEVIRLQEQIAGEINAKLVGSEVEVLVEGPARRSEGRLVGKTPQFKTTVFPGNVAAVGSLVTVRVQDSTAHTLSGTACYR